MRATRAAKRSVSFTSGMITVHMFTRASVAGVQYLVGPIFMPDIEMTAMAALASVASHRKPKNQTATRLVAYIARTWR